MGCSFPAGLGPPASKASPYSALGFRFKVFADYEAYIKCQGQVDKLFMVRAAHHCLGSAVGGTGMSVLLWSPSDRHETVGMAEAGSAALTASHCSV